MDQMLEQIKIALDGVKQLSDNELQTIASYLVGQTPFETIRPMLGKGKNAYFYHYFYRYTDEILEACGSPEMLKRLGRHMQVLHAINEDLYWRMMEPQVKQLGAQQAFLSTGLGPQELLMWLFERGHIGSPSTPGLLDTLCRDDPGALEAYIQSDGIRDRLRPLAYLCARDGKDILTDGDAGVYSAQLTEEMLVWFGAMVRGWERDAEAAFYRGLEQYLPAALPLLRAPEIDRQVEKLCANTKERAGYRLASALVLTEYRLPNVNALARAACEADYFCFLDEFYGAIKRYFPGDLKLDNVNWYNNPLDEDESTQSILRQVRAVEEAMGKMGVSRAYVCAWAAPFQVYSPPLWNEAFDELYGGDRELLEQAAACSVRLSKAVLLRKLHDLGAPLPDGAAEACIQTLRFRAGAEKCGEEQIDQVAEWLLTGQGECAVLPGLEEFFAAANRYRVTPPDYDPDLACWSLAGAHPIAGRYLDYIVTRSHSVRVLQCVQTLLQYLRYTPEAVVAFIEENTRPAGAILCLATTSGIQEGDGSAEVRQVYRALIAAHPDDAVAAMAVKSAAATARLAILDTLYQVCPDYDPDFLIACLGDKSKKVRQYAVSFLLPKKELIEKIRPLTEAKKKDVREAADQLLAAYEGGNIGGEEGDVLGLCTRLLPKNGLSAIRWALPGDLPAVRWRDTDDRADETVVKCYLCLTVGAKSIDLHPAVPQIRAALNESDLQAAARDIYAQWIADGAKPKNKGALLLYAIHATDADILALNRQVEDWAARSRGAIAAEAVRAMAMNGGDLALMTVDNIGRKFKNKQVRRAGQEAFAAAAAALCTTPEALGDRIIPTLGFNERGEREIDYGPRKFTAILSPALAIRLETGEGKTIKSLPKPGAKDDAEKAERAKADFTALKKSLKAVVTTQTQRLEQALGTGRHWDTAAWRKLFVENPIMHSFAIGLVWGVYDGDRLTETFRYMEDGGFTTVEEDDFDFENIGEKAIGLVHPLDMDAGLLAGWKQQMEDYEIAQPISQLERAVYRLQDDENAATAIDRFGGKRMLGITLMNKLQKSGWYRGSVQDGGCFYTFYREIEGVGMQVYFSGMYVSPDPSEEITMGQAGFYKAGSVDRGSYVYDDVRKDEIIALADVSPRMFSELILDLTNATATSGERDETWRQDRSLLFFDGK